MRRQHQIRKIYSVVALLALSACSSTTDPPGSGRPQLLWSYNDPAGGDALPYADTELSIFTTAFDRRVMAFDARSGKLRWQRTLPQGPRGLNLPPGNVLAAGNLILLPGWDLYALDRTTGQVSWRFAPEGEYPAAAPIAMEGERVFSPGSTGLYAVDVRTGTQLWRTELGERPFAPVVDKGVIYLGTRGFVGNTNVLGAGHAVAVDASDGRILWKVPVPDPPNSPASGGVNRAGALTPELFIVAARNGRVYGIDRATGQVRWEHRAFESYVPAAPYESGVGIIDGIAVVANLAGMIEGLDAKNGTLRWRISTGGSSVSEQITTDGMCAYISVGAILCVDATGKIRWDHGGASNGGPSYLTPARVTGNRLYVGSTTGFHALVLPR